MFGKSQKSFLKTYRTQLAFTLLVVAVIAGISFMPEKAQAGKIFADQTGLGCAQCHSSQGMANGSMRPLTSFGLAFQNNGYRVAPRSSNSRCPRQGAQGVFYESRDPSFCAMALIVCQPGQKHIPTECGCGCMW